MRIVLFPAFIKNPKNYMHASGDENEESIPQTLSWLKTIDKIKSEESPDSLDLASLMSNSSLV